MKENLKEWALIAEITGAIAIVISLIFVGSEIRQSSNLIQFSNYQTTLSWGMVRGDWLRDKEFAEIYELALNDYSGLSSVQKLQFDEFFGQQLNIWEFAYYAHNDEMMSDIAWEGWDTWYRVEFRKESFKTYWQEAKRNDYTGEFKTYADSVLLEK